MADFDKAVHDMLANDAAIALIVANRVRPVVLKQDDLKAGPSISFQRISTDYTIGYSHAERYTGLTRARLQIDIWSYEYGDLVTLGALVVARIHLTQFMTAPQGSLPNRILNNRVTHESEASLYRRIIDALIWFQE